jgi:hypothetical protein
LRHFWLSESVLLARLPQWLAAPSAPVLSGLLHDIECSFEPFDFAQENIVGDGGEVDLDGCFGDAMPSHSAKPVASFPGAKDFLDPAPHPVDWLVPVFELLKRLWFVTAPHAGGDNARHSAFRTRSSA